MFLLRKLLTSNNFASLYGFKVQVFSVKKTTFQKNICGSFHLGY